MSVFNNFGKLRRREKCIFLETTRIRISTLYHHISFDEEFYAEFEFFVEILFRPRISEKYEIFKICVGGSKNFLRTERKFIEKFVDDNSGMLATTHVTKI